VLTKCNFEALDLPNYMAFELRAEPKNRLALEIGGVVLVLLLWWGVSALELVSRGILPAPLDVLKAFPDMHVNNALVRNVLKSVWLNFQGYFWAVVIAVPIGLCGALYSTNGCYGFVY